MLNEDHHWKTVCRFFEKNIVIHSRFSNDSTLIKFLWFKYKTCIAGNVCKRVPRIKCIMCKIEIAFKIFMTNTKKDVTSIYKLIIYSKENAQSLCHNDNLIVKYCNTILCNYTLSTNYWYVLTVQCNFVVYTYLMIIYYICINTTGIQGILITPIQNSLVTLRCESPKKQVRLSTKGHTIPVLTDKKNLFTCLIGRFNGLLHHIFVVVIFFINIVLNRYNRSYSINVPVFSYQSNRAIVVIRVLLLHNLFKLKKYIITKSSQIN